MKVQCNIVFAKYRPINKTISTTVLVTLMLSACNSGGNGAIGNTNTTTSSIPTSTNSVKKVNPTPVLAPITPVIILTNSSSNAAACSYFLHNPNGAAEGQTPIGGAGSMLPVGGTYTWNYTDKDLYSSDTTQTAVCGYNRFGRGLNGPGSQEGNIYFKHNTTNNTLIITATGLPTSKATLTCLNTQGKQTTTIISGDYLTDYTCSLTGTAASTVSINFGGALNTGTPPADPANTLVVQTNKTTFTQGSSAEANCMTDNSTGLMWVKDLNTIPIIGIAPGAAPLTNYTNAINSITALNQGAGLCGHNDWRLPSINEMSSLINYTAVNPQAWLISQGFVNLAKGDGDYWTSTAHVPNEEAPYSGYFWVPMLSGSGFGRTAFGVGQYTNPSVPVSSYQTFWVWPVRSTQTVAIAPAPVAQTGDTISVGVASPTPRFVTDSSNSCMIDKLTGLTWVKDQTKIETFGGSITVANFEDAQQTVARLNKNGGLCGFTDWRVPHVKELSSLINYTKPDFTAWLISQGFNINSTGDNYSNGFWTSDPLASSQGISGRAWYMQNDGEFNVGFGLFTYYNVLPVRGSSAI